MSGLFVELNGHVTEEQMKQINKTGIIPSAAKSPEEKQYYVIFKSYLVVLKSQLADNGMDITGECIIVNGRHNMFDKIKEYLDEDAEMAVDIKNSLVMVEGVDSARAVSLYRFIKLCNKSYPNEAYPEEMLDKYLEGFYDEKEIKNDVIATGNGNYCGTLLEKEEN